MESIKTKLSDVVFAPYMAAIIVDFVVVCSRSHSENLKIPMQNPFSRPLIDSKRKEFQKSEIGLQNNRKIRQVI